MKLLCIFCYVFLVISLPVQAVQAASKAGNPIVCLESVLNDGETLIGTGFFIAPGIIATVQHQVKNAKSIAVYTADKSSEKAKLLLEDSGLAVLSIANKTIPYLLLAAKTPEKNTPVATAGCLRTQQDSNPQLEPIQQGIISDPNRLETGRAFIEANLSIKKGNSGGPLLTDKQQVVGIINGYDENNTALSVSVPSTVLIQVMAKQQVIAFDPEITALWQKAQASQDTAEQLSLYDTLIQNAPWHTEAHYNQGIIYFKQHDYPNAKAAFLLTIQLRPHFYNAYIYLGTTLSALKEYAAARNSLIQAILIDTQNPLAYSLIAGVYQNGLADPIAEHNALEQYVTLETSPKMSEIARGRLQKIEQTLKP